MNFGNIGINTLQESNAFKKIKTFSKAYNTSTIHTPSVFTNKYKQINSIFFNENTLNDSLIYGNKRQHNLLAANAVNSTFETFLDKNSMDKFLTKNLNYAREDNSTNTFSSNIHTFTKPNDVVSNVNTLKTLNSVMDSSTDLRNLQGIQNLITYKQNLDNVNIDSDKKKRSYPIQKYFNSTLAPNNTSKEFINFDKIGSTLNSFTFDNN